MTQDSFETLDKFLLANEPKPNERDAAGENEILASIDVHQRAHRVTWWGKAAAAAAVVLLALNFLSDKPWFGHSANAMTFEEYIEEVAVWDPVEDFSDELADPILDIVDDIHP